MHTAAQLREGVRDMVLTARSGETVTLQCPYAVGRLSGCYYGSWRKNSTQTQLIGISSPGPRCLDVKAITSEFEGAKYSIDRSTFNLTIANLVATDSDVYICDLSLVDPAVSTGQTVHFINMPGMTRPASNTLSVDGEITNFHAVMVSSNNNNIIISLLLLF